jgi:hypothetical protein
MRSDARLLHRQTPRSASFCGAVNISQLKRPDCCVPLSERMPSLDPELDVAAGMLVSDGARFVVVGGFAVIANRFVRATEDIDFLVPDDDDNDRRVLASLSRLGGVRLRDDAPLCDAHLIGKAHLRAKTRAGIIDILRGGLPPLDFDTVEQRAIRARYGDVEILVASLSSIVGFKRLADRARDRNDLIGLEEVHGALPIEPLPGLDN